MPPCYRIVLRHVAARVKEMTEATAARVKEAETAAANAAGKALRDLQAAADAAGERVRAGMADAVAAAEASYEKLSAQVEANQAAAEAQRSQLRNSGESYINHPLAVARIVADIGLDEIAEAAALMHDAVEDTEITLAAVNSEFGAEVAAIVDGVTKLDRIQFDSREAQQAATMRKMLVARARDLRVLVIKLAVRLHNLRTLAALPADLPRSQGISRAITSWLESWRRRISGPWWPPTRPRRPRGKRSGLSICSGRADYGRRSWPAPSRWPTTFSCCCARASAA